MNHNLQIFKEKILQENLSKTETYWIDQIDFQIVDNDLNLCVNSEFVKTSIEKKVFDKILNVSKSISEIDNCIFILDPSKKVKKTELSSPLVEEVIVFDEKEVVEVDLSVFNNLLVGSSNNLAITAAKNVVQSPGSRFNPLFIHGKPGVGKTHLLKTMEESSRSSYYIDSESFLESYVSGIKNQSIDLFKNKIRSVDILLIDDIQFFMGKKGVSEELFHTINYFLNNNKAVVLVSDQKPQDLLGFPERLISRILNGLVTDIEQPSSEIFKDFLIKINEENNKTLLTESNIEDLSKIDISSFRDINGIVNSLVINKQTGVNNTNYILGLVRSSLNQNTVVLTPEYIFDYVSNVHQIDKELISSKNRSLEVGAARHLLVALMRKHTDLSLSQIGLYLGNRSHSTVLSYLNKAKSSAVVLREINSFDNKLNMVEAS
ncbi:DnaA/Hda family protein [Candidatus Actinomarina sp.]|jgi:chromosomal replication initiator protein|nr:DnaA/Hda family protein [Acidimicrobiia bacterium]MDA8653282.1 DnaA/Hda family protein [Candidatus Actinomarina sp.]MDA9197530.1 DnaA/Hda family protein [Acidimicrobiia bacterium]MDA9862479.1 DnaA/Hda family protein [Acidimicrobiia bacterium]MDB3981374.1 DnaA/Hda family protein [Acidimicrobiia bacterium]|tara:strand:+ start:1787 stop:3085 length:1299 start_codon:yes stop_codon:yes gene_type:complete